MYHMAVIICTIIYLVLPLMVIEIVRNFSLLTIKNISWVLTSFWMISSGFIPRSEITGSHGLNFEGFLNIQCQIAFLKADSPHFLQD